jgi:hypothetical protein
MPADCLSIDDVINFPVRGCLNPELCCASGVIGDRIEEAVDIIEKVTGHWLCPREKCFKVKGRNNQFLYFPPEVIAPISSLTSIKDKNGNELDLDHFTVNDHFVEYKRCLSCCTYEICGEFGFSSIPPGLKRAVLIMSLELLQPGITGYVKPFGITRADWEDFSLSYRVDDTFNLFGSTTGFREIDDMVNNYMNHAGMMLLTARDCPNESCVCCRSSGQGNICSCG